MKVFFMAASVLAWAFVPGNGNAADLSNDSVARAAFGEDMGRIEAVAKEIDGLYAADRSFYFDRSIFFADQLAKASRKFRCAPEALRKTLFALLAREEFQSPSDDPRILFAQARLYQLLIDDDRRLLISNPGREKETLFHDASLAASFLGSVRGRIIPHYVPKIVFMNLPPAGLPPRTDPAGMEYPRTNEENRENSKINEIQFVLDDIDRLNSGPLLTALHEASGMAGFQEKSEAAFEAARLTPTEIDFIRTAKNNAAPPDRFRRE